MCPCQQRSGLAAERGSGSAGCSLPRPHRGLCSSAVGVQCCLLVLRRVQDSTSAASAPNAASAPTATPPSPAAPSQPSTSGSAIPDAGSGSRRSSGSGTGGGPGDGGPNSATSILCKWRLGGDGAQQNFLGLDRGIGALHPCSCQCLLEALHESLPVAHLGVPAQWPLELAAEG